MDDVALDIVHTFLCRYVFAYLLGTYLEVELQGQRVILF